MGSTADITFVRNRPEARVATHSVHSRVRAPKQIGPQLRGPSRANVRWNRLGHTRIVRSKARAVRGDVKLVGAIYDLATGRVRFLE